MRSFVQVHQSREESWPAHSRCENLPAVKASLPIAHLIKIERKAFDGCIGHHTDAVEGNIVKRRLGSYAGSLHFHYIGTGITQLGFFRHR